MLFRSTKGLSGSAFKAAQIAATSALEKACATADAVRCDVVSLYHGDRYHLYKYDRFQDVRLVFAPEQAIAFFGGDPDNFSFPRFDLDVAFLRAWQRGAPASTPEHLALAPHELHEGDATFVVGNPRSTSRELTAAELEFARDVALPKRVLRLAELRGELLQVEQGRGDTARRADRKSTRLNSSHSSVSRMPSSA